MPDLPKNPALPIRRKGFMFVLSSPSGAGKTTLSRLLLQKDKHLAMSISCTTREKRPNEEEGKDYYFLSTEDFKEKELNGDFLESAKVFGHHYGTPRTEVIQTLESGDDVLFDIDWQGTKELKSKMPEDVVSVFILPPSLEELELRLRKRAQDKDEVVAARMAKAENEISHWKEYDYVIVNKDIEDSLNKVYAILRAERYKRLRQQGLHEFVQTLKSHAEN